MEHYYQSSYAQNASFWREAAIDKRFKVGDQGAYDLLYGGTTSKERPRFHFNLIARHVNMIVGRQRQNRKSTVALPMKDGDDSLASDISRLFKWCENRDGFQEYLSQSFEDACDTGISFLHLYPDYSEDAISGDLLTDNVESVNILVDPYFRKQDLSDCNFLWRRQWVSKSKAKALFPALSKEIDKMRPLGAKDGRFPLQAELLNLDTNQLFSLDEFYYRSFRDSQIIIDPVTQESSEWFDYRHEKGFGSGDAIRRAPYLKRKKVKKSTVRLCICLNERPVYNGPNLLEIDRYPFVPVLAYHEPDVQSYSWRIRGVVRNLRDPQFLYNMRKGIELDILQSQINSGWIYPVDALADPQALRQTGQGYLVALKRDRSVADIQRIEPPSIPQGLMELSQGLAEDITKISGVNEELLGSAQDDKAGILSMLRQGAGLTTLQTLFDKLDYSQRLYGQIRLESICRGFSPGKIQSILGKEPDYRIFSSYAVKYGIAVEEGNYSSTQRQTELQQLLHFREIGMPIPDQSILRSATITDKDRVMQEMSQAQQQQQLAQQSQAETERRSSAAQEMERIAKARLDIAREQEVLAKSQELVASAEKNQMQSDLELVQMMMGLETMDLEQIERAFNIAQAIKQANQPEQKTTPQPQQEEIP